MRVGAAARLLYARADGGVVKVDPPPAFARARRGQGVADVLLDGETEEDRLLVGDMGRYGEIRGDVPLLGWLLSVSSIHVTE